MDDGLTHCPACGAYRPSGSVLADGSHISNLSIPEYALTVRQPWAWAIITGHKHVENRKKRTHYRGRIAIHAGLTWDKRAARWMRERGLYVQSEPTMGALIGEVTITDCLTAEEAPAHMWSHSTLFDKDPWKWMLTNPVRYPESIPVKGALGLWKTAPRLADAPRTPAGASQPSPEEAS